MEMALTQTKVFEEEFKGSKMFAIYEVNVEGEKIKDRPVMSMGIKKATTMSNHTKELRQWVDDQIEIGK